jgi:DNA helicase II / ATP-dependent DNA helicase PcrA
MTSSKGREFDAVLVLGVDEGKIPHYYSRSNAALLQEDRRKFYVSLTRARHECHFFYSGFTETPWGAINRDGPSRFLSEIELI